MSCDHACICTEWRPIAYPFHDTTVLTCACGHTRSQHSPAAVARGHDTPPMHPAAAAAPTLFDTP